MRSDVAEGDRKRRPFQDGRATQVERRRVVVVAEVVVAGVIFVGHGQGHDHVCDYDHPSSFELGGASILERRLFLPPSATSLRLSRD